MSKPYGALVIGGGFFGCSIARYLKGKIDRVLLVEQEGALFRRASYANQARIHNGYHYPRSLHTAYRSRVNFQAFVRDFSDCVVNGFTKIYCVGRQMSKVSALQFERFCHIIGAPLKPARSSLAKLFDSRLIEAVYEVKEYAFDSGVLRDMVQMQMENAGVEVRLGIRVDGVEVNCKSSRIMLSDGTEVEASLLFNCTYAGLKHVKGLRAHCQTVLKYEITEMALIEPPVELKDLGVTVMCGPFFSTMPFPPRGLHTLSHVRYTPHCSWIDNGSESTDPYQVMRTYAGPSKAQHMLHDAQRYLPVLSRARIDDSLFEVKTLLLRNEVDDGRPILMERSNTAHHVFSVMGGKIDNIYDVIQKLQAEGI